jgi:hypothetical protein
MAVTRATDRAMYIEVPADLKRRLKHEAIEREIPMRDIVLEALTAYFATQDQEAQNTRKWGRVRSVGALFKPFTR